MRKILLCVFWQLLLAGCGSSTLPKVDDVCSVMDDICFMKYCYASFDANEDGKVSMAEANAVSFIDCAIIADELVSLKGIEYFSNLTSISCEDSENIKTIDLSRNNKIVRIPDNAFSGCLSLESIILPETVNYIGDGAFAYSNLKSINIPDNVKDIGKGAFYECEIKEFKGKFASSDGCCLLNDGILVAFCAKRDVTTYRLPEDVRYIMHKSFDWRSTMNLKELIIPKNVEFIDDMVFENAEYLISIKFECPTPPEFVSYLGLNRENIFFPAAFENENFKIYVPEGSVAEYKNNTALQRYAKFIEGYE